MSKLSAYPVLSAAAAGDTIPIVDIDDPTESPVTGSTKKITVQNLLTGGTTVAARMPWNVLGGWAGSNADPANTFGPAAPPQGTTCAAAVVADGVQPFNSVGVYQSGAGAGTGALLVVTDASGNWLASQTDFDTVNTQAASDLYYITLNATITPAAPQTVYYVVYLFPATSTPADYLVIGGANQLGNKSKVTYPSFMTTNSAVDTTIANPVNFTIFTALIQSFTIPIFTLR